MKQNIQQKQINDNICKLMNREYDFNYDMFVINQKILCDFNWLELSNEDEIWELLCKNIDSYLIYDEDIWTVIKAYHRPTGTIDVQDVLNDYACDLLDFVVHLVWAWDTL